MSTLAETQHLLWRLITAPEGVAAALACNPGLARAISRSCASVSFLAHAAGGAAMVTAMVTADRSSRRDG